MLELNDPLWDRLVTMFRNDHVPTLLSALAASWDEETADTLLWGELWHQQSCCSATQVGRYLLSGVAAADGLIGIASLLNRGCDGQFMCASCGCGYEFIRFGERIVVYADTPREDKALSDFRDGAPSR